MVIESKSFTLNDIIIIIFQIDLSRKFDLYIIINIRFLFKHVSERDKPSSKLQIEVAKNLKMFSFSFNEIELSVLKRDHLECSI